MPIHTLVPNISLIEAFASASRNAGTADQTGIDLTLYEGELDALISCGSVGASGTLDAKWQESDDNSTFTDCTGADTNGNAVSITQITAAGTARIKRTVRKFTKRYARIRATVGVNAVVFGVTLVAQARKGA